jgi:phosphohistidine phosphatase SixA
MRPLFTSVLAGFLLFSGFGAASFAQTVTSQINGNTVVTTVSSPQPVVPSLAVADEPFALSEGLVRELRRGGYNIYLRHGAVIPGSSDKQAIGEWWKNCDATQRLAPQAMPQAQLLALALISQRVAVDEILTSEFCRAADTALFLGIVAPKKNAALNDYSAFASVPANKKRPITDWSAPLINLLATPPSAGRNRILVGHATPANTVHPILASLPEGHAAIFRPEGNQQGNNRFHLITTLSPGQLQAISRQSISDTSYVAQPNGSAFALPPQVPPPPAIDPAKELKGAAIIAALRKGGYNLYMRHAVATDGQDMPNLPAIEKWWDNCAIQRKLVDTGREQARKVGSALKQLKVPIATVKASQFCRVRDTATLMDIGAVEITEDLNHQLGQRMNFDVNAARFVQMATKPPSGKNVVMVSHTHGSTRNEERVMAQLQEAEIVMYLPDGKGGSEPVARIPVNEWDALIQLAQAAPLSIKP